MDASHGVHRQQQERPSRPLAKLYPITASLGLIADRSHDAAVRWSLPLCAGPLLVSLSIAALLLLSVTPSSPPLKKRRQRAAPQKTGKAGLGRSPFSFFPVALILPQRNADHKLKAAVFCSGFQASVISCDHFPHSRKAKSVEFFVRFRCA